MRRVDRKKLDLLLMAIGLTAVIKGDNKKILRLFTSNISWEHLLLRSAINTT